MARGIRGWRGLVVTFACGLAARQTTVLLMQVAGNTGVLAAAMTMGSDDAS